MILLLGVSLLMIWSTSFGGPAGAKEHEYFYRQSLFIIVGFFCYLLVSRFDYRFLSNFSLWIFLGVCGFLVLTYLWGLETRGSTRWIDIGSFRFQPSEFVKPALILVLAAYINSHPIAKLKNLLVSVIIMAIPAALIFKQPDLGSAVVIVFIWLSIVLAGGIKPLILLLMAGVGAVAGPVAWLFLKDYQRQRLEMFLNPSSDPLGSGYNIIQALIAVGSGEVTGRGFGRGTQSHLNFLPEYHTDFIFATLAEELGFVGSTLLIVLFAILVFRTLKVADKSADGFGALVAIGVGTMVIFQVLVNIGMNMGVLPVTGIPLPLVSYGGSSLISTMISLGLVQSIAANRKNESEGVLIKSI